MVRRGKNETKKTVPLFRFPFLIQVAHSVIDEKAYQREFNTFNGLDNSRQKILITNDDMDYSTSTVRHIRLRDFLESDDL